VVRANREKLPSDGPIGHIDETPLSPPDSPGAQDADFVWFDSPPELISIKPPHYPEMVRDAGIDGTVYVRVLVGVNGRVKDASAIEGSAMLRNDAVASARTALFKPALQGTHPVETWVVIPITFVLHDNH
jgi:TonB family protein